MYRGSTRTVHCAALAFPSLRRFLTLAPACWPRGKIPPHFEFSDALTALRINGRWRLGAHVPEGIIPLHAYKSVPAPFDTLHYVFCGLSPDHVNQCATICLPQTFGRS